MPDTLNDTALNVAFSSLGKGGDGVRAIIGPDNQYAIRNRVATLLPNILSGSSAILPVSPNFLQRHSLLAKQPATTLKILSKSRGVQLAEGSKIISVILELLRVVQEHRFLLDVRCLRRNREG